MTRDELRALVAVRRAEFYAGDPLYCGPPTAEQRNCSPCGCDGRGQVHHGEGALSFVTRCSDDGCIARREAEFMGNPIYCAPACPVCEDSGLVSVAIGPTDRLSGQPDEIAEAPCPACRAGDAEAEHRIGRPWRGAPS